MATLLAQPRPVRRDAPGWPYPAAPSHGTPRGDVLDTEEVAALAADLLGARPGAGRAEVIGRTLRRAAARAGGRLPPPFRPSLTRSRAVSV